MSDDKKSVDLQSDDVAHFSLLMEKGINLRERSLVITTEFSDIFDCVDAGLSELERINNDSVVIKINSPGGCAYDATAVLGRMKASPCKIITEGYGQVMSAATIILAGGDYRKVSRYCSFMWHHGSINQGTIQAGDALNQANAIDNINKQWSEIMAKHSRSRKANAGYWYSLGMKDTYLNPKELKKLGVVDEII